LICGLGFAGLVDLELFHEAGDDGLDGGVEEGFVLGEREQALVEVLEELLGVVVVFVVAFIEEDALEVVAHAHAARADGCAVGALGFLLLVLGRAALVRGRLALLGGEPELLAVDALLHGEGLAQAAAGRSQGPVAALEGLLVGGLLQPGLGLLDGHEAGLGHAGEHGVDALRCEDGRGRLHSEQT
jgi:hypothetical protein